jgi:preprotein translocase subunit SecF
MKIFARVPNINFMAQRKTGLIISLALTIASVVLLATRGLNFGIDFTGGVLVEVAYPQTVELEEVRKDLDAGGYHNAVAQYFGGTANVLIRLPPAENASTAQVSTKVLEALHARERGVELRRIEFVGAQVGEELTARN